MIAAIQWAVSIGIVLAFVAANFFWVAPWGVEPGAEVGLRIVVTFCMISMEAMGITCVIGLARVIRESLFGGAQ